MMRFGFNAHSSPPEAYIDYAVEHGLKHIEIDLIKDHSVLDSFDDQRIRHLADGAGDRDLTLSLHAPYTIDLSSRMPLRRRANIAYLKRCVALAGSLKCTHVTVHIGRVSGFPVWPWKRIQALDTFRRVVGQLLPGCERAGVPLALENACGCRPGSEAACLGDCVDDFVFLFGDSPSPDMKICLDLGHANTSEGPVAFVRALGPHIISLHCHDNLGTNDEHLAIGDGTVPWQETGRALREIGFCGPCVSECFYQSPHETAACLMKLWEDGCAGEP